MIHISESHKLFNFTRLSVHEENVLFYVGFMVHIHEAHRKDWQTTISFLGQSCFNSLPHFLVPLFPAVAPDG